MPERIDGARVLSAIGAALLLVSLFLDWYAPGISAWEAFEVMDLALAAVAIASLAAALSLRPAGSPDPFVPARWLPALAAVALLIVCAALLNHPPAALGQNGRAS